MHPPKNHRVVRQGPAFAGRGGQLPVVAVTVQPGHHIQAFGLQPVAARTGILRDSATLPAPRVP